MNRLPLLIPFLLLLQSSAPPLTTSAISQLDFQIQEVDGLTSCLARNREGTPLDRWLSCVDSQQDVMVKVTSSGPDPIPQFHQQPRPKPQLVGMLEESSSTEQQIFQDEPNLLHSLGGLAVDGEVSGTLCSLGDCVSMQQQQGLEVSPQVGEAYAAGDGTSVDGDNSDLQFHDGAGNQPSGLSFPGVAIQFCGFLFAMLLRRFWKCRQSQLPQANIHVGINTPTIGVAAVQMEITGMTTEFSATTLSAPLGMAIGTVVAEALERTRECRQHFYSADQVSKLLEVALEAQLLPVMGTACRAFVGEVKKSFQNTFHTLRSVRDALPRPADMECCRSEKLQGTTSCSELPRGLKASGQDHGIASSMHMEIHEKSSMHIPIRTETIRPVSSEVVCFTPEVEDVCSDSEDQWLVIGNRQGVTDETQATLEAEDACSQTTESYINTPLVGQAVEENNGEPYSVAPLGNALMVATSPPVSCLSSEHPLQQAWLDAYKRCVHAQEQRIHLKKLEIMQKMRDTSLKEEKLQVSLESNQIMQQTVDVSLETNLIMRETADLSRMRALMKEKELEERKLEAGYLELKKTCTDDLAAGICVMFFSLGYGGWTYSYDRLAKVVSSCQPVVRERRHSLWMGVTWYQSAVDSVAGLACELTVAGRMLAGTAILLLLSYLLLRRSLTSSSQAMPVSVIVIVLGVIFGFAGKLSVDSLGGSGLYWLLLWESLCLLHAFASCFTPFLYRCLNGCSPQSLAVRKKGGLMWVRPFTFRLSLVLWIPLLAGLVPFASFRDLMYSLLVVVMRKISRLKPEQLLSRGAGI